MPQKPECMGLGPVPVQRGTRFRQNIVRFDLLSQAAATCNELGPFLWERSGTRQKLERVSGAPICWLVGLTLLLLLSTFCVSVIEYLGEEDQYVVVGFCHGFRSIIARVPLHGVCVVWFICCWLGSRWRIVCSRRMCWFFS